jgi:hypothetical protein
MEGVMSAILTPEEFARRWAETVSSERPMAAEVAERDAAIRAEERARAARIARQPQGYHEVGLKRLPYWDGEEIARLIEADASPS